MIVNETRCLTEIGTVIATVIGTETVALGDQCHHAVGREIAGGDIKAAGMF